jgi:hypothetical protein
MEKVQVGINRKQQNGDAGTLGMPYLLNVLKNSDLYDISFHDEYLKTARDNRATTLTCNGKKVYLDFWEYPTPTYTMNAYRNDFDLIIKIQDQYMDTKRAHKYLNRKKMMLLGMDEIQSYRDKIVPWTFFPSRLFEKMIGKEDELWVDMPEVDKFGFFCGKAWKCRNKIMAHLANQGIEVNKSNQGTRRGRPLSDEGFVEEMKKSKFGIVLAGRSTAVTDAKNRREMDYMMLKKPLLLNYKPKYYNELVEGVHYIHFNENTDLKDLENRYNIEEIGENGYKWYVENVKPEGAANVFRQILKDKLDI